MAKVSIDELLRWRSAQPVEVPTRPPIEAIFERARLPWWKRLSPSVDAAMRSLRSMPTLEPVSATSGRSGSAAVRVALVSGGGPVYATLLEFEVSEGRILLSVRLASDLASDVSEALFSAGGNVRIGGAVQLLDSRTLRFSAAVPDETREEWKSYRCNDVMPFDLLLHDVDTLP